MVQVGDCYFSSHEIGGEKLILIEDISDNGYAFLKQIQREGGSQYIVIHYNRMEEVLCFQDRKKVDSKIFLKIEKLIKMNYNICSTIASQASEVANKECKIQTINSYMFVTYRNETIALGYNYISIRNSRISVHDTMFSKDTYIEIKEKTSNTIKSIEDLWTTMKTS